MAQVFFYCALLLSGLMVAGATGDLISFGSYRLLFGPGELAQSISNLGDMADSRMALESALFKEYGTADIAEVIRLLSERYEEAHPVTITAVQADIDNPIYWQNSLDGIVAKEKAAEVFNRHNPFD